VEQAATEAHVVPRHVAEFVESLDAVDRPPRAMGRSFGAIFIMYASNNFLGNNKKINPRSINSTTETKKIHGNVVNRINKESMVNIC
jgi:hypothetical protein